MKHQSPFFFEDFMEDSWTLVEISSVDKEYPELDMP